MKVQIKRSVSIILVILVAAVAWYMARPANTDIKTDKPYTLFEEARAQNKPVFIMFTSDG